MSAAEMADGGKVVYLNPSMPVEPAYVSSAYSGGGGGGDDMNFSVKDYLDARDSIIRQELQGVGDRLTASLDSFKTVIGGQLTAIDADVKARPDSVAAARSLRRGLTALFLALVALLASLWAAFDTGAAITGAFSDEVLGARAAHVEQQTDIATMNAKYEQIDGKLDAVLLKLEPERDQPKAGTTEQ